MVLFDSIVQILISPVFYTCIQFTPDRARVTVVTVRRDTRGRDAGHRFGRSENAFAAAMSRFSLSLTSTRAPERSMAR
jgi:hypothetical protein